MLPVISNFLEEISSLSHSSFPLFLCIDHWGRLSYLSLLFFGTLHSNGYIFPFLLCLSLLFFSQLFVRPPQITIFSFCISFSWGWSWSLPPVQCHQPLSIVLQALCHIWSLELLITMAYLFFCYQSLESHIYTLIFRKIIPPCNFFDPNIFWFSCTFYTSFFNFFLSSILWATDSIHSYNILYSLHLVIWLSLILLHIPISHYRGFPGDSVVKNLPANAGDIRDRARSLDQGDPLD